MLKLSKLQIEYLENHAPNVGITHRYNIIAAIKKRFRDIDDFLMEITPTNYAIEFLENFEKIRENLDTHIAWIKIFADKDG